MSPNKGGKRGPLSAKGMEQFLGIFGGSHRPSGPRSLGILRSSSMATGGGGKKTWHPGGRHPVRHNSVGWFNAQVELEKKKTGELGKADNWNFRRNNKKKGRSATSHLDPSSVRMIRGGGYRENKSPKRKHIGKRARRKTPAWSPAVPSVGGKMISASVWKRK